MINSYILASLEALLFASGEGLSKDDLSAILELKEEDLTQALQELEHKYSEDASSALSLRRVEERYLLSLKPCHKEVLERLYHPEHLPRLSAASYETLAAVLYNQPVTKAQVELVRGVNSDGIITRLLQRGLLEECGVLEQVGRPSLFRVSEKFMLEMGISSVEELKPMELLMYENLRSLEEEVKDE